MASRTARAAELVAQLKAAGVHATSDVAVAAAQLPGVLVPPPRLTFDGYAGPTVTWRLVVLAPIAGGALAGWQQLDELVETVAQLLPVETGEPSSYVTASGSDPLPAYVLTLTESE